MISEEKIQKYNDWLFRKSAYDMALSIIMTDKMTVAPIGGSAYRDARTAYLSGELFSIVTDPEILEILREMKDDNDIDPDLKRAAYLYYKDAMATVCIPKEEFVSAQEIFSKSYDAWLEAKTKNDYSIFEPWLKKVIEIRKQQYEYRKSDMDLYDQMLDDYEPGMNREKYDVFFNALKERLVPLIEKVCAAEQIDDSFLYQEYDIEEQKRFSNELLKYLHFDADWGYQNETEHPFTNWVCENDCRTTTKYLLNNVASAILSTVHEVGHATYEHDCDDKYDGMILSEGISSGMHESQSRLFENYLGRSYAFWEYLFPILQKHFPAQLGNVTAKQFTDAVNVSRRSLVRTEADELTYPLHILVRYEIEKGLFDGSISTEGLDETWNALYEKYLGIKVPGAREGILQDVHWSDGSFGYFPTYALGSAFSAQFTAKMREEIDVDEALRSGHFEICIEWLKEHIHKYGCRYDADDIMKIATGREFDVNVYLDYLEEKYTKLYHLK
ncbi:MAG: carboxypeptidase M32 [Erysipelotrichaceae bacterium]|nr:carboxypeptidase M32 [Erysipelotrichaceae bacterium]